MQQSLEKYVLAFSRLKSDKSNPLWKEATLGRAPHKPLLLLSVLDLFAEGRIQHNFIELTPDLGELFNQYWSYVFSPEQRKGLIAMPFWHLKRDGFWHIVPKPSYEQYIQTVPRIHAISKLEETVLGVRLDESLYELLLIESNREALRQVLVTTYFSQELHQTLLHQGVINQQIFEYSQELLDSVKENRLIKDLPELYAVRDQAFRVAVRQAYDHHCAMTGLRVITIDGHSAVVAAHIIPWSHSQNDDPRNGLALSHTCHWAFDEGLLTITDSYRIKASPQLSSHKNAPHYLKDLDGQPIIAPLDEAFQPSKESLKWHRKEVFRSR